MEDKTLKEAFQSWDVLSATREEVMAYEARLKQVLDEEAALREAELREKEALEKGRLEGIEVGIEKGKEVERQSLIIRMNQKGADNETIADFVGVSVEKVESILREWEQSKN